MGVRADYTASHHCGPATSAALPEVFDTTGINEPPNGQTDNDKFVTGL